MNIYLDILILIFQHSIQHNTTEECEILHYNSLKISDDKNKTGLYLVFF